MIIQMVIDRKNFLIVSDSLGLFITHLAFLGKLTNFLYFKKKLLEIEEQLQHPLFYHRHSQINKLQNEIWICQVIARIYRSLCIFVCSFYLLIPYFDVSTKQPLPGWLPFNATKFYFETVLLQMSCISSSAYNNSTIDILTWMLICIALGQFEILKENLREIRFEQKGQRTELYFKKCIKHHSKIIK